MKKYRPLSEKTKIIRQLAAMGIKVTAQDGDIIRLEMDGSRLPAVKALTKMDFEEETD